MSATIQGFTVAAGEELLSFVRLLGQAQAPFRQDRVPAAEIERLSQLSDAQLESRGLKRDEIARRVFQIYFAD